MEFANQRKVLRERAMGDDTFNAALKQEVRTYLRGLAHGERLKALGSDDPLIRAAVTSAPAFLSGLRGDLGEHTVNAAVEEKFGAALEDITQLEAAYEVQHAALSSRRMMFAERVGYP